MLSRFNCVTVGEIYLSSRWRGVVAVAVMVRSSRSLSGLKQSYRTVIALENSFLIVSSGLKWVFDWALGSSGVSVCCNLIDERWWNRCHWYVNKNLFPCVVWLGRFQNMRMPLWKVDWSAAVSNNGDREPIAIVGEISFLDNQIEIWGEQRRSKTLVIDRLSEKKNRKNPWLCGTLSHLSYLHSFFYFFEDRVH